MTRNNNDSGIVCATLKLLLRLLLVVTGTAGIVAVLVTAPMLWKKKRNGRSAALLTVQLSGVVVAAALTLGLVVRLLCDMCRAAFDGAARKTQVVPVGSTGLPPHDIDEDDRQACAAYFGDAVALLVGVVLLMALGGGSAACTVTFALRFWHTAKGLVWWSQVAGAAIVTPLSIACMLRLQVALLQRAFMDGRKSVAASAASAAAHRYATAA